MFFFRFLVFRFLSKRNIKNFIWAYLPSTVEQVFLNSSTLLFFFKERRNAKELTNNEFSWNRETQISMISTCSISYYQMKKFRSHSKKYLPIFAAVIFVASDYDICHMTDLIFHNAHFKAKKLQGYNRPSQYLGMSFLIVVFLLFYQNCHFFIGLLQIEEFLSDGNRYVYLNSSLYFRFWIIRMINR